VPSSSRRPKLPEQTKLTASTADLQQDREVPLHTPPPESGRQITAPVQIPAQGAPPRDLLQVGEEISPRPLGPGPTPEQLGETIDLDEPPRRGPRAAGERGADPPASASGRAGARAANGLAWRLRLLAGGAVHRGGGSRPTPGA
jgi:hypothetical protein